MHPNYIRATAIVSKTEVESLKPEFKLNQFEKKIVYSL